MHYLQQCLYGPVGCERLGQLLCAAAARHHAQVQVELRQRARLGHTAAHAPEVPVRQLAAPHRQQPHAVLLQTVANVSDLCSGQSLSCDLNGTRQHPGGEAGSQGRVATIPESANGGKAAHLSLSARDEAAHNGTSYIIHKQQGAEAQRKQHGYKP